MRCPRCGTESVPDAKFCTACRADLTAARAVDQARAGPKWGIGGIPVGGKTALVLMLIFVAGVVGYVVGRETVKAEIREAFAQGFGDADIDEAEEPVEEEPTEAPTPRPDTITSGIWRVGTDIQPGMYRTEGQDCYWARLAGFGGDIEELIANGNTDGPAVVTIAPSDAGFEATGACVWEKIG